MRFRAFTTFAVALVLLCSTVAIPAIAQAPQTPPPTRTDANVATSKTDQDAALKEEEKANKQRDKAAKAQRKLIRAQEKADKAEKKASEAQPK